jgi:hypothetical protein
MDSKGAVIVRSPDRESIGDRIYSLVTENTARSHLNKLVEKNLLVAAQPKNGKTILYLAPANLKSRLRLE